MKEQQSGHPPDRDAAVAASDPQPLIPTSAPSRRLDSSDPAHRARLARQGLRGDITDETRALLLRQLFGALVELGDLEEAWTVALERTGLETLREVSHHDAACVLGAMGNHAGAEIHHRAASRVAPPERRSFHLWCTSVSQLFSGEPAASERTLDRALRWSSRDRPLLELQRSYAQLLEGKSPENLRALLDSTRRLPADERKYRGFLLGMIEHELGDDAQAQTALRHWLRCQAGAPAKKALSLAEELRRARRIVGAS